MIEQLKARYRAALHRMQAGVALKMNYDTKETTPKHLRVGVNAAMVDSAAIAALLIKKGVITEDEFAEALAQAAEREANLYEHEVQEHYGRSDIKLGSGL